MKRKRTAANVQPLLDHRNAYTIGWCAAFVQWNRLHIVQRAYLNAHGDAENA